MASYSRTFFPSQVEREERHVAFCLLHDDDHQDLKCRIANPIAFQEQDGYEVVNVLLETRDEYLHSDNFILNPTLLCVRSALLYTLERNFQTEDEVINILSFIYHDVFEFVPINCFFDDLGESSSCSLMMEVNKVLLDITDCITSKFLFAFVGTFENYVQSVESATHTFDAYLVVQYMHNIAAFAKELYFERKYRKWNIISEEEIFYIEIDRMVPYDQLTEPHNTLRKIALKKVVKKSVVKTVLIHLSSFQLISELPEGVKNEWLQRRNVSSLENEMPSECCICYSDVRDWSSLAYLSGCIHLFCLTCVEKLATMHPEFCCPLCRVRSRDYISFLGFFKLCEQIDDVIN